MSKDLIIIGAGAVVTKDIPDYALLYGNPARVQGWVCECGAKLDFTGNVATECPKCSERYIKQNNIVRKIEKTG